MKKIFYILLMLSATAFVSCDDFLDELPDKRAELNTPEKLAQMLVSGYSTELPTMLFEYMSDNVEDNGPNFTMSSQARTAYEAYHYEDITEIDWDVPQRVWKITYEAIASANETLKGIEELNDPKATNGIKAEALLCRAFGHFMLANTFCIAYNPQSSTTDLGIPYIEKPETTVDPKYDRGTVAEVYEKIYRDIEEALPLHSESHMVQLKYHFNYRAAYAFAARFNLYYGKWDKAVAYATKAIGQDPTDLLRDWSKYKSFTVINDWLYSYIDANEPANLLVLPQRSLYGRVTTSKNRYGHNRNKAYETVWQNFPWGGIVNYCGNAWGSTEVIYVPKVKEIFEITNPTTQTGQPHIVLIGFTADETLACRAEANAMLGNFDEAAQDLNYWYRKNSPAGSTYTASQIAAYYNTNQDQYRKVNMQSRFGVEAGIQEGLVHAALAMRRFDGLFEGIRFPDIKRHGIQVDHLVMVTNTEKETLTLEPYDPRTAIQLPADIIFAGLEANPR